MVDIVVTRSLLYGIQQYIASNDLLESADTEKNTATETTPKWIKEIEIIERIIDESEFRIKFDLKGDNVNDAHAQIYKNDIAIGTQRTRSNNTYNTYSEDLSGFERGDKVQLYYWHDVGGSVWIRNFRIYGIQSLGIVNKN